jgi:hypothetical protein
MNRTRLRALLIITLTLTIGIVGARFVQGQEAAPRIRVTGAEYIQPLTVSQPNSLDQAEVDRLERIKFPGASANRLIVPAFSSELGAIVLEEYLGRILLRGASANRSIDLVPPPFVDVSALATQQAILLAPPSTPTNTPTKEATLTSTPTASFMPTHTQTPILTQTVTATPSEASTESPKFTRTPTSQSTKVLTSTPISIASSDEDSTITADATRQNPSPTEDEPNSPLPAEVIAAWITVFGGIVAALVGGFFLWFTNKKKSSN